jgi:hypothetical protein
MRHPSFVIRQESNPQHLNTSTPERLNALPFALSASLPHGTGKSSSDTIKG